MSDALEYWRRALRDRFVLEREIERRGARTAFFGRVIAEDRCVLVHAFDTRHLDARQIAALRSGIERASALRHERILPIEENGDCRGAPYFVTPFVEGVTLETWLERERELPFLEAARVLSELALALAHAHRSDVFHGELSTADVLWSETHVKLCNLGAATSPVARRSNADAALADIRAFGTIAYEVLAGRKPLGRSGDAHSRIVPVNELRHHIPPGLAYVVMRCLSSDRARAWRSVDELLPLLANLVTPPQGYVAPQLVNQGHYLCRRPGPRLRESLERFESAVAIDPRCAHAHAGVAHSSCLLAMYGYERAPSATARAKQAVERALAIDASLVDAHIAVGLLRFALERDFGAARESLETAIALAAGRDSDLTRALSTFALFLTLAERGSDDGIDCARRAVAIDPDCAHAHGVLARALAANGRREEALSCALRAVELDSTWDNRRRVGLCLASLDRRVEAIDALRRASDESERHPWTISALACVLASSGARAEAEALLGELIARAQLESEPPFAQPALIAQVAAALGRAHDAAAWIERARREHDPALVLAHPLESTPA